jgi:hypothetical protein
MDPTYPLLLTGRALFGLVIAALPQVSSAQIVLPNGIFQLNLAKSKHSPGSAPMSQTLNVQGEGPNLRVTLVGIDAEGNPDSGLKYPPAKPGALRCEPLKAAYPGGFGAVSHLLHGMLHQVPKRHHVDNMRIWMHPICRGVIFASSSIDGAPFRVLGGSRIQSFIDGPWIRLREMSNFCCHPGRAGGTPIMVYRRSRRRFLVRRGGAGIAGRPCSATW